MSPSPDWNKGSASEEEGPAEAPAEAGEDASLTGRFEEEQELLRRHVRILRVVKENEPVGIIKLSELTEFPQHKVRYSLRVLEEEGLIEPTSMGAKTTDLLEAFIPKLDETVRSMREEAQGLRRAVQ